MSNRPATTIGDTNVSTTADRPRVCVGGRHFIRPPRAAAHPPRPHALNFSGPCAALPWRARFVASFCRHRRSGLRGRVPFFFLVLLHAPACYVHSPAHPLRTLRCPTSPWPMCSSTLISRASTIPLLLPALPWLNSRRGVGGRHFFLFLSTRRRTAAHPRRTLRRSSFLYFTLPPVQDHLARVRPRFPRHPWLTRRRAGL